MLWALKVAKGGQHGTCNDGDVLVFVLVFFCYQPLNKKQLFYKTKQNLYMTLSLSLCLSFSLSSSSQ